MLLAFTLCIQLTIVESTRAEVYKDPATLLYRIETKDPVVFITIDDGKDRPANAEAVLNRLNWPITSFLVPKLVGDHAQWFSNFGRVNDIGSHTTRHIALKGLSYEK